jgi:AraC family transcriptional regulator
MHANPPGHLYGTVLHHVAAGNVRAVEARYEAMRTPRHRHEAAMICAIVDGAYVEHRGGAAIERRAGTVFLHPAGDEHASAFDRRVRLVRMEIAPSLAGGFLDGPAAVSGGAAAMIAARIREELTRGDDETPLVVEGLTLELLAAFSRQRRDVRGEPAWLRRLRESLHEHFAERLTLAVLASEAGVHPVHMASVFRRATGSSVAGTLRRLRIDYARRELARSDRPIADIALDAGFSSQSHLTTAFRRETGVTPAAFRRAQATFRF